MKNTAEELGWLEGELTHTCRSTTWVRMLNHDFWIVATELSHRILSTLNPVKKSLSSHFTGKNTEAQKD